MAEIIEIESIDCHTVPIISAATLLQLTCNFFVTALAIMQFIK